MRAQKKQLVIPTTKRNKALYNRILYRRCAAGNGPHGRPRATMQQYKVGRAFQKIAIDIAGPFPKTDKENKYLTVSMDYFSNFLNFSICNRYYYYCSNWYSNSKSSFPQNIPDRSLLLTLRLCLVFQISVLNCDSNVQLSYQRFGSLSEGQLVFGLSSLAIFTSRSLSSSSSDPSCEVWKPTYYCDIIPPRFISERFTHDWT